MFHRTYFLLFIPFLRNSPTGQTRLRIFTLDGSNDADSCKDVPFWGFFSHYSPFRGSTPLFWGLNRRFQAKLAKSKDMHIIKTTASIPTKFCRVIKTNKCPSWVVPTRITNARWRTAAILEKSKNCYISATV